MVTFPFNRQPFSGETLHKATEWDTNTHYFQVEKVYRGFSRVKDTIMRYLILPHHKDQYLKIIDGK